MKLFANLGFFSACALVLFLAPSGTAEKINTPSQKGNQAGEPGLGNFDTDSLSAPLFSSGGIDSFFNVWMECDYHEAGLDFIIEEVHPTTRDRYRYSVGVSTPFGIEAVAARHGSEVVVAGRYPDGRFTMELWRTRPPEGGFKTTLPNSSESIGMPVTKDWAELVVEGEVSFIPPPDRSAGMQPQKVVLYLGTDFGGVRQGCLAVDPHGRFVLFIDDESNELIRFDLQTSTSVVIADSVAYPLLAMATTRLFPTAHESTLTGEYWWFVTPEQYYAGDSLAFVDVDNDGLFERVEIYTPQDWADTGFAGNDPFLSHLGYASATF